MRLAEAWDALHDGWKEARIRVTLDDPRRVDRAAQLLGPLQPFRAAPNVLSFRVVGHSETVRRLLERLDDEGIHAVDGGGLDVGADRAVLEDDDVPGRPRVDPGTNEDARPRRERPGEPIFFAEGDSAL